MGCNTFVHGSNARNLCIAVLLSTSKNTCVFSSTKLEIKAEQVLPGIEGWRGGGGRGWGEEGRDGGWGERGGGGGGGGGPRGGAGGGGGEMTQTMYAH
jgi:hypothetical protein